MDSAPHNIIVVSQLTHLLYQSNVQYYSVVIGMYILIPSNGVLKIW